MTNIAKTITSIEHTNDKTTKVNNYDARNLIGPKSEARIVLDDQVYVLRITKQNKLILTK